MARGAAAARNKVTSRARPGGARARVAEPPIEETAAQRVAVPTRGGAFCPDLDEADAFLFFDAGGGTVSGVRLVPPPPPRLYPEWLHDLGVSAVIAGGMGCRACRRLEDVGIDLVVGTGDGRPEGLVRECFGGELRPDGKARSGRGRHVPPVATDRTEGCTHV
jgi:predicted Fe-Mo cluster-binding NifX family protein